MRGVETREQGIENPKRSNSRWVVEDQEKEERKGARFSKWGREMRRSGQDKVGKRTKFEQQGSLRHNSDSGKYSQCFTFSTFCHNRALFQNGFNNFFSPLKILRTKLCSSGPSKQQKYFSTLYQIYASRQSCPRCLQTIPLSSCLVCAAL